MIKEAFAKEIVERRRAANLTQEDLASNSGVAQRFLQSIEAGDGQPTITTLFKLAKALETTADELIVASWNQWVEAGCPE